MTKPVQKVMPKAAKPFDPNRTKPVPDDPRFAMDADLDEYQTQPKTDYDNSQNYKAPSQRDNPVRSYCKGGKVISTRRV